MLPNNFIFSQTESLFQSKLDSNEIKNEAIAFMADTGRIWTHGTWFATPLTAEDIQNLIEGSTTLVEYIQTLSPAEVSVSDTQPSGEEKIWVNGNSISFKSGDSWSTPIDFDNFLSKDNTLEYTPAGDYNPATKKYVDDQITERDNVLIIDYTDLVGSPINETVVSNIIEAAQEGKAVILKADSNLFNVTVGYNEASNTLELNIYTIATQEDGYDLSVQSIIINTLDNTLTSNSSSAFTLVNTGDGLKYLSDDGTYKTFPDMATVVELNSAVLALTNESSSEDIIAAFDSAAEFSNLITQIRDSDNIVNEVLLDTDGYIGHINASLAVSKTDEIIHIRFIDNNDKLVFITVTNNAGTFSCTRTESNLVENVELVNDGDGNLFLSNDGTYKEAGDKTNVLILSLENDLANGQKDSPINAEVSASLVDAITTGKACVIKSANSDILANLQQIGNNVTIIMEQISRVGQTFVAVNTTITVNTATNVIADYQTGAIVLETEGDGSKFLSNDGTYKEIESVDNYIVNINDLINIISSTDNGNTVDLLPYQDIISSDLAYSNHKSILIDNSGSVYGFSRNQSGLDDILSFIHIGPNTSNQLLVKLYTANLRNGISSAIINNYTQYLIANEDGTKFLSNDGTYKEINTDNSYILNYDNFNGGAGQSGFVDTSIYNNLKAAIEANKYIFMTGGKETDNINCSFPITAYIANDIIYFLYFIPSINDDGPTWNGMNDIIIYKLSSDGIYKWDTIHSNDFIFKNDVLTKTNTTSYTPTADYHPATKKYVDDNSNIEVISKIIDTDFQTGVTGFSKTVIIDNYTKPDKAIINLTSEISDFVINLLAVGNYVQGTTVRISNDKLNYNGATTGSTLYRVRSIVGVSTLQIIFTAIECILSESEYSALGDSTASDGVLYFITPD